MKLRTHIVLPELKPKAAKYKIFDIIKQRQSDWDDTITVSKCIMHNIICIYR